MVAVSMIVCKSVTVIVVFIFLLGIFHRNFINNHISILDHVYKQHTINKSTHFCP